MELLEYTKYQNLALIAKDAVEGFITGKHKSPYHGFSVEFSEHKAYNLGESTKGIDWKVFARTEKLYVKKFEEETNVRCQMILDISPSMFFGDGVRKIDFSIFALAALSHIFQKQRDAFGLCTFDEKHEYLTQLKSTSIHLRKVLGLLEKIRENKTQGGASDLSSVLNSVARKLHKRSLVILFTDFFDSRKDLNEIFVSLKELKHNNHEVIVFHVLDDDKEKLLNYSNKEVVFEDSETGEKVKLNPKHFQQEMESKMNEFCKSIKVKCGQYKIDYITVDTAYNLDQVLAPYLNKRARMR